MYQLSKYILNYSTLTLIKHKITFTQKTQGLVPAFERLHGHQGHRFERRKFEHVPSKSFSAAHQRQHHRQSYQHDHWLVFC